MLKQFNSLRQRSTDSIVLMSTNHRNRNTGFERVTKMRRFSIGSDWFYNFLSYIRVP